MAMQPPPPKRKPLGPALKWDSAALDALSAVTPATIAQAQAHWRNVVDPRYADLLDAKSEEPL